MKPVPLNHLSPGNVCRAQGKQSMFNWDRLSKRLPRDLDEMWMEMRLFDALKAPSR